MAVDYERTTWADGAEGGTAIDAAKLNNIEKGIADTAALANQNEEGVAELRDYVSQTEKAELSEGVTAYRRGCSVSITFNMEVDGSLGYTDVGALPEGWRPPFYVVAPAYLDAGGNVFVDANDNGKVSCGFRNQRGKFYGLLTYVVA